MSHNFAEKTSWFKGSEGAIHVRIIFMDDIAGQHTKIKSLFLSLAYNKLPDSRAF